MPTLGFGERIRRALLAHASQIGRHYSAREFAEEVGKIDRGSPYSASAVTEWIAERSEPSLLTFHAMAKVLNRPVAWLMALDVTPGDGGGKDEEEEDPAAKKRRPRGPKLVPPGKFVPVPRAGPKSETKREAKRGK